MHHPRIPRRPAAGWVVLAITWLSALPGASAADGPPAGGTVPGHHFTVAEPITSESIAQLKAATQAVVKKHAAEGVKPVLVFEFASGGAAPGASEFFVAYNLADFLSTKLGDAWTVAYIPEPLKGYALLPALACDDIVLGSDAPIGPITPEEEPLNRAHREPVRILAQRKQRDPELLLGMLERTADLRAVRTGDNALHFVPADQLPEFRKSHQVVRDDPAWEGGNRGVLTVERAREQGFAKLIADTPAEVAASYHLAGWSTAGDPTLGQDVRPGWVRVRGPIDGVQRAYLNSRINRARQRGENLLFFEIDSPGGSDTAADSVSDLIAEVKDIKTVAFIDDRALGVAALVALSCHDIVFRKGAVMGDVRQVLTGRNGRPRELDPGQTQVLARHAAMLAEKRGHPPAIARAMVDPDAVVLEARDTKTGAPVFVLESDAQAEPGRYVGGEVRKSGGQVLTVTGDEAATYRLGQVVADAEECKALYGLRGKTIAADGPTWVDSLVTLLNDPLVSWLLLFVGMFMLVLELKLPGIGLPAITSALAFLLFFWSKYLSGTADQLEIMLFLVGMVCVALELFVFPGFGVFGMSGVLLILASIVMASHAFVWPTHDYEYREFGHTLLRLTGLSVAVAGGAVVLGRYFPSLPVFNRLILKAEPWTGVEEAVLSEAAPSGVDWLAYLVGETGRTTTVLRPTGKAKFGDRLVDVTSTGGYIEADSLIEVVDVQGPRVFVRRAEV